MNQNERVMKTLTVFLIPLLLSSMTAAQTCLPEGIVFNTQAQVDNFSANYPGCTRIEGDVLISGYTICNLNGLNVLLSVGGDLKIESNEALSNTTGLNALTRIDGSFYLYGNLALTCLSGLEHLASIGGDFSLVNNPSMNCMNGLQGLKTIGGMLWIDDNDALANLSGLDNLEAVGGTVRIYSNDCLVSMQGLNSLQGVGGSMVIGGLGHLGGLGNSALTDISALASLNIIGGNLEIGYNALLPDLNGLDNIQPSSIDELRIFNNATLSECAILSICDYLTNPGSIVFIVDNASGCNSVDEVSEACELLGVAESEAIRELKLFPNPTSDILTIEMRNVALPAEVCIFSAAGRELMKHLVAFSGFTLDCRSLPSGFYHVIVINDDALVRASFIRQ
jgi:hypothetical protein